ncbi:MAG: protease inhibitor I42 family protein [Lachnospiraceae bacterium]|nr:protease inhibitor I42 family protein [Candidatus Equihabitans merdae]
MKKFKRVAVVVSMLSLVLAVVAGCGKKEVKEGVSFDKDVLTVVLAANPTTGYTWAASIDNEAMLTFVSDSYETAPQSEGAVGVGGFTTMTFKAVGPGTATVTLTYGQQWEGGNKGETRAVTVTIGDKNKIETASISDAVGETAVPADAVAPAQEAAPADPNAAAPAE